MLRSAAGYYIGTLSEGMPNSRDSQEYYRTQEEATLALETEAFTWRYTP